MIVIIGAGPIGCFLGYLLAKEGKDVAIYEEHSKIGSPVQCTGIITEEIKKIIDLNDKIIINKVDNIRIFSKNNKIDIPINDIVVDRTKFDKNLAKLAKKEGAKIYLDRKSVV